MDKKNILIGVCFLFATVLCITGILKEGYKSYYLSGLVLFTYIGIAFIRKANARK